MVAVGSKYGRFGAALSVVVTTGLDRIGAAASGDGTDAKWRIDEIPPDGPPMPMSPVSMIGGGGYRAGPLLAHPPIAVLLSLVREGLPSKPLWNLSSADSMEYCQFSQYFSG